jgi:alpha-beta hydrolase superfamily lysophospholipase
MNERITNPSGEVLDYTFNKGNAQSHCRDWIILLGHGVTGNKERPVIVDTAQALNQAGLDTLAFSFAGNGDSEGDFKACTISKESQDLSSVLDAVSCHYANILYLGHSMGGAVGLLVAAQDRRIRGLISLAGMIDTKTFAETEFGDVVADEGCMWEDEDCPLSSAFMKDLCETIRTLEPLIPAVQVPWLLIHGTADDVVLPCDTEKVVQIKGTAVAAAFIDGADHSFNKPTHKEKMTGAVVDWVRQQTLG